MCTYSIGLLSKYTETTVFNGISLFDCRFFKAPKDNEDLSGITQKLQFMYSKINVQIGLRVLTEVERQGKSPLSKGYPKHAGKYIVKLNYF